MAINPEEKSIPKHHKKLVKGTDSTTKPQRLSVILSFVALIISILSLYFASCGVPGDVEVLKPVGYGIIRKIKYINYPSDHLVLPLDWINHSGRQKIIREVTLKLCKLNDSKKETGEEYLFELAGEFPSISASSFNNPPGFNTSFIISPNSNTTKTLFFHIKEFANDKSKLHKYKFNEKERYKVYISYSENMQNIPYKDKGFCELFVKGGFTPQEDGDGDVWGYWYETDK